MKSHNSVFQLGDPKSRSSYVSSVFITMSLISNVYFIGSAWMGKDNCNKSSGEPTLNTEQHLDYVKCKVSPTPDIGRNDVEEQKCDDNWRPIGTESLPKGIVSPTSNLEMYPLSGPISLDDNSNQTSLLALAVGLNQRELVNQIVEKFLGEEFVVMLFHYDGIVDEWRDMEWSDKVIHISATNQTKWWFAKRFLHPDIVENYDYIFLWDEDLGVDNFHLNRYVSIIMEEGLEISQPALDPAKSWMHHQITERNTSSRVHRRYYSLRDTEFEGCDDNSKAPPCVGWVEMMAPVFSRAAWRCVWYMIQNDLIHAWGLDFQLGYCAQGDRTVKVGVVDEEYIVHLGLPTLGGLKLNKMSDESLCDEHSATSNNLSQSTAVKVSSDSDNDERSAIRQRSFVEMEEFANRWNNAVKEDQCWIDPFKPSLYEPR